MIDLASASFPFASATLPPCVEHAITHGPADDEVLDWALVLARFWKGLGADEETVARNIESWYSQSDAIEDLDGDDIKSIVRSAYISDRSKAHCEDFYPLKSFQGGCVRAECILFNPPTQTDIEAMPKLDEESFVVNEKIDVALLADEVVKKLHIKRLPSGQLAVYNNGIYAIDDSEILIDRVVRDCLRNALTVKFRATLMLHIKAAADAVEWDDFERFTHLLCCPNCVVDLKTGQALDHSPDYMMLHKTRVPYKPRAERKLWEKVVGEILPAARVVGPVVDKEVDEDQQDYFRTLWGYSCTGEVREEIAAIHQGAGAAGKTTITSGIQYAMGSYVLQVDPDLLAAKKDSFKPTYELANGVGKRIFLTNESKDGAKLNTQLIKRIATEGQEFNARQIYGKPFTYTLRAKAHLVMNPPPILDEQDKAVSRRLHYIRYLIDFSGREDKELKKKLQYEAEGILAWLVEGAIVYYKNGIKPTVAVVSAVNDLFADSDPLYGFIDANIDLKEGEVLTSTALYESFIDHCKSRSISTKNFDPKSFGRMFNAQIRLKGWNILSKRSNGETKYTNIQFKVDHVECFNLNN